MKKIHKKIGAVALASMIVAGGFGASKVESHAFWSNKSSFVIEKYNWNLNRLSKNARIDVDYLLDYLKYEANHIKILAASDNKHAMDRYIQKKYAKKPELKRKLLEVPIDCFYGRQVVGVSNYEKSIKNNIVKVKFGDSYVIVSQD